MTTPQDSSSAIPISKEDQRTQMGAYIFAFEAEMRNGHVVIENLPADDGGGAREVAGINLKYDPTEEPILENLVNRGEYATARDEAIRYYLQGTAFAEQMTSHPATEFLARDIIFNRGQKGCIETVQKALGITVDGLWGPASHEHMSAQESNNLEGLLQSITEARRWYETVKVGVRGNFEAGLENRWAKALEAAKTFL